MLQNLFSAMEPVLFTPILMQRVEGATQRHGDVFPAGMCQVFLGLHCTLKVARGSVKQSTSVLQLSAKFSLLQTSNCIFYRVLNQKIRKENLDLKKLLYVWWQS